MIDSALTFLEQEVNRYFDAQFGPRTQPYVELGNIANIGTQGGGSPATSNNAQAIFSLVNIEEDRISKNPENTVRTADGLSIRNPRVLLNLYLLFASTAANYPMALQTIGMIVQCFQSRRFFEASAYPGLPPELERLTMDLCTLNFEQVNHLWSTMGGKYLPSVLYKLRVVPIEDVSRTTGGNLIEDIQFSHHLLQK